MAHQIAVYSGVIINSANDALIFSPDHLWAPEPRVLVYITGEGQVLVYSW